MTTEASLVALNEALPSPVGMDRFRANIVIGGTEPFAEVCIFYTSLSLFNSYLYLSISLCERPGLTAGNCFWSWSLINFLLTCMYSIHTFFPKSLLKLLFNSLSCVMISNGQLAYNQLSQKTNEYAVAWENSRHLALWFPRQMTSGRRRQKFHTYDMSEAQFWPRSR